jgi:hypothetical protein
MVTFYEVIARNDPQKVVDHYREYYRDNCYEYIDRFFTYVNSISKYKSNLSINIQKDLKGKSITGIINGRIYALGGELWEDIIMSEINGNNFQLYSDIEIIASIFWEMSYYGLGKRFAKFIGESARTVEFSKVCIM